MKVGYLGPYGSYSRLAAESFRPEAEFKEYPTFPCVMDALKSGECDYVVLPIENSLNGGVNQNIDLLQTTENVIAFEEHVINIDHRFATLKGAEKRGISRIYSHQQALAQCGGYIRKNYPNAQLLATPSTAASLELLKSPTDACIVGSHIKKDGVELSSENISDEKCNVTHFLLIKNGSAEESSHSQKIFFSVTCRHESGALLKLLKPFSDGGMNMTKIVSRPIKEEVGAYRFFIEAEGDYSSDKVKRVLSSVKSASLTFKLLGAY
ncbi:MAG: hypothetical protein HDP34_05345 [Clostridia bacterium]|nr:hypothetical protein [Clostridia bacterium]